ncbi:MAG: zinc ribbon domain-containing protein [Acidobacteriia bacterium]|nr:zinc ribbon domain-containing protein [Terriglobia bacterium]
MPIYEYKCTKCGEIFEAFQKITDLPLTECRFCGGKVDQLISHSSFQLKGSGWYLTDYAKKSQPSQSPASTSDSPKAADKSDTGGNKGSTTKSEAGKGSA